MARGDQRKINWPRLFGYDFFISFKLGPAPGGTQSYASDLARGLRENGFEVFYSEEELPPGDTLEPALQSALRRSRSLVVICHPATLATPGWVRNEVEVYRKRHPKRAPVVINVGKALEHCPDNTAWLTTGKEVWIEESAEAVAAGIVSPNVLARLSLRPRLQRANVWLRLTLGMVAVSLGLLALLATLKAIDASAQRDQAESTLARADFSNGVDRVARDDAGRAIPYLARAMLLEPARTSTAMRLSSLLLQRPHPRLLEHLRGFDNAIHSIVFAPNGRLLAAATSEAVYVWDMEGHRMLLAPARSRLPIKQLAFSPDSRWFAVASAYDGMGGTHGELTLWDLDAPEHSPAVLPIEGVLWSARFAPHENAVVTSSAFAIEAWSLDKGNKALWKIDMADLATKVPQLQITDNAFSDFAFLDDGLLVVYGSLAPAVLGKWQSASRHFEAAAALPMVTGPLTLAPSGKNVLLTFPNKEHVMFSMRNERSGSAVAFDVNDLSQSSNVMQSSDLFADALILPHEQLFVTGGADGKLSLWTSDGQLATAPATHREALTSVDVAPHGMLLASGSKDGVVRVWNALGLHSHSDDLVHASAVTQVKFAPRGAVLATGTAAGAVTLWDVDTPPAYPQVLALGEALSMAGTNADGSRLATVSTSGHIVVWDVDAGRILLDLRAGGPIAQIRSIGTDRMAFVRGSQFLLADLRTGRTIGTWRDAGGRINQVSVDADSQRLLTATETGIVDVWTVSGGELLRQIREGGSVTSAVFLADGNIAAASESGVSVWNSHSGAKLSSAKSAVPDATPTLGPGGQRTYGTAQIVDLAMAADGAHLVVTYGHDGMQIGVERIRERYVPEQVAIWDLHPLKMRGLLSVGGGLTSFALSPSAKKIALGSEDGNVRLWSTETAAAIGDELKHTGRIQDIQFIDSENGVVVSDNSPRLSIWHHFTRLDRAISLPVAAGIKQVITRPGLILTLDVRGAIEVRDARTGIAVVDPLHWPGGVHTMFSSATGTSLLASAPDGRTAVWRFPVPANGGERCALAYTALRASGYTLDSSNDPVPLLNKSLPPELSTHCPHDAARMAEPVGAWLALPVDKRPIAPGMPQGTRDFFSAALQQTAPDAGTFNLLGQWLSSPCARLAAARRLTTSDAPGIQKIGTFIAEYESRQGKSCDKK